MKENKNTCQVKGLTPKGQALLDKIYNEINILKSSTEYAMVEIPSLENVLDELDNMKRNELLAKHPYKIWQGKNGKWYTYIPDDNGGRSLKNRTTQEAIENVVIESIRGKIESPTVKDIFLEWSKKRLEREEIEKATYSRYQRDFEKCFKKIKNRKIKKITELDIEDFIKDTIREEKLSQKAFSNMRTLVYGIFKYAKKKGLVTFSIKTVVADMEFSRKEFSRRTHENNEQVFMVKEEETMVKYLTENQDLINLGLLLLFKSGLRIGELSVLQPADITDCNIHVCKTETIYKDQNGKVHYDIKDTAKTPAGMRTVVIPKQYKWILDKIKRINPFGEYLFMQNNERIRSYQFRTRLYTNCRRLGIVLKSPHKIRKTYGTKLYDSPIPKSVIIEQMGHTDISCLEKHYYYNRLDKQEKEEAINQLNVI